MIYAIIKDGIVLNYPLNLQQLKDLFPNVSFPNLLNDVIEELDIYPIELVEQPTYDPITQAVAVDGVVFDDVNNVWKQNWKVVNLEESAIENNIKSFVNQHTVAVQNYMDNFARTRNYDNMQSAITYLNCGVPKFETEAQYCSTMRAQIWSTLYGYLAEVEAGIRQMEVDSANVIALLPVLEWPPV